MNAQNSYRGARAVVIGGAGFIGSWVARALVEEGAEVWCVVRPGGAGDAPGRVIEADLCDPRQIRDVFRRVNPGVAFNLAGYGVDPEERDEELALTVNADAVEEICRAAAAGRDRSWRGQAVVHAGSALEYGEADGGLREDGPAVPTTMYGIAKLAGTRSVERWSASFNAATARLFTVYGPGEHPGRLLPSLLDCAASGKRLRLTSGVQKRDFTYVGDVVDGLLRLGLCRQPGVGTVNLATGRLTPVREFVNTAAAALAIPADRLEFGALPTRAEEMHHARVNLDKLEGLLGWTPPSGIAEGIRKTLAHLAWRANLHAHISC